MNRVGRRDRSIRLAAAGLVGALLACDLGALAMLRDRAVPMRVATVVERYRLRERTEADTSTTLAAATGSNTSSGARGTTRPGWKPASAVSPGGPSRSPVALPIARPVASATGGPPPGVYVYATTGHEEVDALGGSRHDYPAQTTITVANTGCGRDLRWDALTQRWDAIATCLTGSEIDVANYTTHHEFFNVRDQHTYRCPPGTAIRPAKVTPGLTTESRCSAPGAATTVESTVGRVENVAVGDTVVPTLHVHIVQTLTGQVSGTKTSDIWFATVSGLIVRLQSNVHSRLNSAIGQSDYKEVLELRLASLTPQR